MVFTKVATCHYPDQVQRMVEEYYDKYDVVDVKLSTAFIPKDVFCHAHMEYTVLIIYKEKY